MRCGRWPWRSWAAPSSRSAASPLGLLVARFEPAVAAGPGRATDHLTWGTFLVSNLLPVTLGNVIGGVGLVSAVYWFVYLRLDAARGGA